MWNNRSLPRGPVHLVGIGGVGMAGLARLLHQSGVRVSGSDRSANVLTRELADEGVDVYQGHQRRHVSDEVAWAIRTPAVPASNPELEALRSRHIPVFARGDVLAGLANSRDTFAVAGAHGKTTTSAMLLHLLRTSGIQAGYAIGGETAFPGRVADAGDLDAPFVVEADESDGTLMGYTSRTGIITHVEWDHVERFPTEQALCACYRRFARQAARVWIRQEDSLAREVCRNHANLKTVGWGREADLQMLEVLSNADGVRFSFRGEDQKVDCDLPLPGEHNAWNGLMAIGAALDAGLSPDAAATALQSYAGVGRRFQSKMVQGVRVIQDYAHHPTELRAVLDSVKALEPERIWMAFQPHRYSRTQHLLHEFAASLAAVDHLALLPVYAAFEKPEQGADSAALAEICRPTHPDVRVWEDRDALIREWTRKIKKGDVVLIAGAGDIENLWEAFGPATEPPCLLKA